MSRKKLLLRILAGVVTAFVLYIILNAVSIWRYASIDETKKADVAIVLGAGLEKDGVSPVFKERINHAVKLYKDGFVDYVIFTGGVGEGNIQSDASVAAEYAMEQGVPENAIFLEEKSTITEENLQNAKMIMDKEGLSTALVVSDPLHMKRAMLMAKDCGIEAFSSPTKTTRYMTLKTKIPFLIREEFFYIGYKLVRLF